jgi:peptidoglycan/LPS O-acetylase OafA/YrhL
VLHNAPSFAVGSSRFQWLVAIVGNAGWIGVQLFFVLSGFLITRQLLDSRASGNYYRVFFARRILRIFPLYYAALLVGVVIVPLLIPIEIDSGAPRRDQIWLWTFLFNWAHGFGAPGFGFSHFWSLAVEEQFYLIWPFVVRKRDPRNLLKLCWGIALTAILIRIGMRASGASDQMLYEFTVCRMDALVIGASVAALLRIPPVGARALALSPWSMPVGVLLGLMGAAITRAYTRDDVSTQTVGQSVVAMSFALILLASIVDEGTWNRRLQAMLSIPLLRSVGKYSYGMYVVHYPIVLGMETLIPRFQAVFGRLYLVPFLSAITLLSYAAAVAIYHGLEKHFLRLKRWFVPTRVSGPGFELL